MARQPQVPGAAGAAGAQPEPVAAAATAPEPASPVLNAIDVDPTKIKQPVLTRQGWVCPG